MERVDCVQSLVMFHSMAGGTGSGVGSALLQYLRDTCPSLTLSKPRTPCPQTQFDPPCDVGVTSLNSGHVSS